MKRRPLLIMGLALGPLMLARPGCTAETAQRRPSPLEGVKALEKPVSYTETKIPLGELVQKIAADTGAPLTAAREVADEPVAVVVNEIPARKLLEQLADLLAYHWVKTGKDAAARYEIYQDVAGRQQEAVLRAAEIAAAEKQLREQIRQYAEMARRPAAQVRAVFDADVRRAQALEKQPRQQRDAFLSTPEGRELYHRLSAADAVSTAVPRVLAGVLERVSPRQWSILRAQQRLVLATEPQPGDQPLPVETARLFQACSLVPPMIRHFPPVDPGQEERDQQSAKDRQSYWAAADGYRVTLRMDTERYERTGKLSLLAEVSPDLGKAPPQDLFNIPAGSLRLQSAAVDTDLPSVEDSPERRAALEKDPVLGRKELFKPAAKPRAGPFTPGTVYFWWLQDLLPELAHAYGVSFISDAYWDVGTIHGLEIPQEPAPLFRQLDSLAGTAFHWDQAPTDAGGGKLIRLRSRTWFFDRPREVPLRFVRHWRESYDRHGALTLDDYLDMVTGLTDVQLQHAGDLPNFGALPRDLYMIRDVYTGRSALRLYASLTPAQRQVLGGGGKILLTQMTRPQQALFVSATQELEDARNSRSTGPARWDDASFAVSSRRWVRTLTEQGEDFTSYSITPDTDNVAKSGGIAASRPVPPGTKQAARQSPARLRYTGVQFVLSSGPQRQQQFDLDVAPE